MAALDSRLKQEWRDLIEKTPDVFPLSVLLPCPTSDLKKIAQAVFMNDVILLQIFSFLKVEHHKRLRLVCRKWKSVGEALFKNRAQICFDYNLPRRPLNLRVFLQNAQVEFPFKSLKLIGPLPLSTSNLVLLFGNEAKFITKLTLRHVRLSEEDRKMNQKNENRSYLREYNFDNILSGIENLKSLEISGLYSDETKPKLSLVNLRNIKYIILDFCTIELSPCTIAPIELVLKGVNFSQENSQVKIVRLNDYVEFDITENLTIFNSDYSDCIDIELDLVGDVTLNHLDLFNVKICNLELASWNVEFFTLSSSPFTKKSNLKIERLSIQFTQCNISCVPQTVNKLCIGALTKIVGTDLGNFSLPNIKYLDLMNESAVETLFPYLAESLNNLRQLKLSYRFSDEHYKIYINHIPRSVEILILGNCRFQFVGEGMFFLNSLIIEENSHHNLQFIVKVTKHFFPKILQANVDLCTSKSCQARNDLIHLKSLSNTLIPRILLGKLHEQHLTYLKSCPSYKSRDNTGEIVNRNGSKITFSFEYKINKEPPSLAMLPPKLPYSGQGFK